MSVRPQKHWWARPGMIGLAAAVVLFIGIAGLGWPRFEESREARRFGEFAMSDLTQAPNHTAHGPGMGQLAALVSDTKRRLGDALPIEFDALKANGCRTVRFAGHDVLEVCFERGGKEFHFYVMKRPEDSRLRVGRDSMRLADGGGVTSAVWSDGRHIYALVGTDGADALRALL